MPEKGVCWAREYLLISNSTSQLVYLAIYKEKNLLSSGLFCLFRSQLSKLSVALKLICHTPHSSTLLRLVNFGYVFSPSLLILFHSEIKWHGKWLISHSLCIFHLQKKARYREAKRGGGREERAKEKGGWGIGLNHTPAPWSPSWSFKWSKTKRSSYWIYKSRMLYRLWVNHSD